MKKIILFSILLLLIPSLVYSGAPSKPYTPKAGDIVDPGQYNANEDTIYNYLAGGVDTYEAGSVNAAAIGANAVGNSEIINTDNFTFSGSNTHSGTTNITGTLKIDGTTVTSSATELNLLDGETDIMASGDTAGGDLTGTYPNPTIAANKIPKVIFTWSGNESYNANEYGMNVSTTQNIDTTATDCAGYINFTNDTTTYRTFLNFKFKKTAGVDTVTIYARVWGESTESTREAVLNVDIGGASNTVKSVTSASPSWVTAADIDVSGLTDGTVYNGIVQLKAEQDNYSAYCSAVTLIGS